MFSLSERNPKRIFAFQNRQKAKLVFRVCLARSPSRGSSSGTARLLPQELHSASQHQTPQLWTVSWVCVLSLFCAPTTKMCTMGIAFSFYTMWAYENFIGMLYFQTAGKTCTGELLKQEFLKAAEVPFNSHLSTDQCLHVKKLPKAWERASWRN